MTITTFLAMFSGSLSISERVMMQEFLSQDSIGRVRAVLRQIILLTFGIELLGAVCFYASTGSFPFASEGQKIFSAAFHAVSAFCNAGFSLFSANLAERGVAMNLGVNLTITTLIILGGIGFTVIANLLSLRAGQRHIRLRNQLTVHTKLVLITTALLLAAGTAVMYALDGGGILGGLPWGEKLLASYFQSVTTRTAGFNTVDIGALSGGTALLMIILMFIGASPGSTGGGIKTSTAAVVAMHLWATVRGRAKVEFGRRRIPSETVEKAFIVTALAAIVLVTSSFLLLLVEPRPYLDLLFECSSALGTVGLSRNLTPSLTDFSKVVLAAVMLTGRVGALTIIAALVRRVVTADYDYPSGNVMIG
jgi:Trk-type K+ transport system membrane component